MNLSLTHTPQPWPFGCMNYSLYSLLGDSRILDSVAECSGGRFKLAMFKLGYYLHPLFVDQTDSHVTSPEWWRKAINEDFVCHASNGLVVAVPLLVDIKSPGFAGVAHCVGVAILGRPGLPVIVFDPGLPQQVEFETIEQFAASIYGKCYHVYEVGECNEDRFESCHGPDQPHVMPGIRERWQQMMALNSVPVHENAAV